MSEQWIKLEPLPGLARCYDIDHIFYNGAELSIVLSKADDNKGTRVRVTFTGPVESYRNTYETFRVSISKLYQGGTFFKIENSEYIKWLSEQSCGIDSNFQFIHVVIATDDKVVDIIAKQEPQVEFVYD
jgi:hypothetical protein